MNLKKLSEVLKSKPEDFIVVGIGNSLKSDDGAGSIFAEEMRKLFPDRFIDVGICVENFIFKIAEREEKNVFVVDAIDFEEEVGGIKVFELDKLRAQGISTHSLGLKNSLKILEEFGKRVYVIGIKPEKISLGREISDKVKKAIENLKEVFIECLH